MIILKARCFDLQETITALRVELARAGSRGPTQTDEKDLAE